MQSNKSLKDAPQWKKIRKKLGEKKSEELRLALEEAMSKPPKIAVIGKAGVGKTTTINNLFNTQWEVGEVDTGTRRDQCGEFELLAGGKIAVIDMPGLGEDLSSDIFYEEIYKKILPDVDVILYVMQANARDMEEDQRILKNIVLPALAGKESRIVIGLNKVDSIGPGNWIEIANYPSREQEKSIIARTNDITQKMIDIIHVDSKQIVYYSSLRLYRLNDLAESLVVAANTMGWKLPIKPKNDAIESIKNVAASFIPWLKK